MAHPRSDETKRPIMILAGAKEAQHKDAIDLKPVEDAVAAIGVATGPIAFVARDQRIALGNVGDPTCCLAQLVDEADGSFGIVEFDPLGNMIKICKRLARQ